MWDPNLIPGPKSGRRSSLEVEHQDPPFFFSDTRTTIIPKALPRSATEEELAEIIGNKAAARSVWNRRSRRSALSQIGGRRSLNQAASSQQFPDSLPEVNPTNGWTTWYFYNNGTGRGAGGVHPMHMHLVDFLICGRRNNVSGYGTRDYEMNVPKDVFYMQTEDEVSIIFRSGPSQGAYMFHCHNLQHEDRGMMALFNNTGINNPLVNDRQTYWNGTTDSNRFYGYEQVPQDPLLYTRDDDPLVRPDGPIIGHNLYYSDSMPPSHMREDPDNPGHPQPITRDLLRRVVARNYYAVFYPDNRRNLATPVPSLPWACVCDA